MGGGKVDGVVVADAILLCFGGSVLEAGRLFVPVEDGSEGWYDTSIWHDWEEGTERDGTDLMIAVHATLLMAPVSRQTCLMRMGQSLWATLLYYYHCYQH